VVCGADIRSLRGKAISDGFRQMDYRAQKCQGFRNRVKTVQANPLQRLNFKVFFSNQEALLRPNITHLRIEIAVALKVRRVSCC